MTLATVESAPVARETLECNREQWFPALQPEAVFDDILNLDVNDLLAQVGRDEGEIDLVHGGPPCTPFSKSGYWLAYKRAGEDPKASLLDEYVRVVAEVRPRAFLMENVYGLAYGNQNRPVLERFIERIRAAGYSFDSRRCSWRLTTASHSCANGSSVSASGTTCSMFQRTSGGCNGHYLLTPGPTRPEPASTALFQPIGRPRRRSTVSQFTRTLPNLRRWSQEHSRASCERYRQGTTTSTGRLAEVTPNHASSGGRATGHFCSELDPDRPSPTIQGQPGPWVGPFHWDNRRLRLAELKRIQEFPDEYAIVGTRREQQLQVGNAVPPRLGYVVALALRHELARLGVGEASELAA